jgi:hypothetical protein
VRTLPLILAWALASTPAAAAAIYRNGNNIYLSGEIAEHDDEVFEHLVSDERLVVHLDSGGGRVIPARRIGNSIRLRGYATIVPANATCGSACTFIWVAGTPRTLGENARMYMHCVRLLGARVCDESSKEPTMAYLRGMGAPQSMINLEHGAYALGTEATLWVPTEGLPADVPLPRPRPAVSRIAAAPERISRPFCPIVSTVTLGLFCF